MRDAVLWEATDLIFVMEVRPKKQDLFKYLKVDFQL